MHPIYDYQNMDEKNKKERDTFYIINPPAIDKRITAQQSCFTFHLLPKNEFDPFRTLNDIISDPIKEEVYFLLKILIHEECREGMLDELNSLGINRHTLFPDLDGLAKHITWQCKRNLMMKKAIQYSRLRR